jgi:hypothetical protein
VPQLHHARDTPIQLSQAVGAAGFTRRPMNAKKSGFSSLQSAITSCSWEGRSSSTCSRVRLVIRSRSEMEQRFVHQVTLGLRIEQLG